MLHLFWSTVYEFLQYSDYACRVATDDIPFPSKLATHSLANTSVYDKSWLQAIIHADLRIIVVLSEVSRRTHDARSLSTTTAYNHSGILTSIVAFLSAALTFDPHHPSLGGANCSQSSSTWRHYVPYVIDDVAHSWQEGGARALCCQCTNVVVNVTSMTTSRYIGVSNTSKNI